MSIYGLSKLAWDLEHDESVYRLADRPDELFGAYSLTSEERAAVESRDAHWLLDHGLNPVVLRNLLVTLGITHRDLYKRED